MGKKNRKSKPDPNRYKTFWRRFWAGITDAIVLIPLVYLTQSAWGYSDSMPNAMLAFIHISHLGAMLAYTILLHGVYGQTLGKMLFRVKVIDMTEIRPITMTQAVRRDSVPLVFTVVGLFDAIPTILRTGKLYDPTDSVFSPFDWIVMSISMLWFWSEFITMLTNKRRRAVHDFIAGSVVIRVR